MQSGVVKFGLCMHVYVSDVVLETEVLVSRRLETKVMVSRRLEDKNTSIGLGLGLEIKVLVLILVLTKSLEHFKAFFVLVGN